MGGANFISNALATILKRAGAVTKVVSKDVVTAIDFLHTISKETVMCNIKLIPKVKIKNPLIIPIEAYIIPSKIDLILGRNTIKDFNLVTLFPSQFFHMNLTARKQPREMVKLSDAAVAPGPPHRQGTILTAIHLRELREHTLVPESIDYEWHAPAFEVHDSIINKNELNTSSDIIDLITIETDKELKLYQVKDLLNEYHDIFSNMLPIKSADVPPLELKVDSKLWQTPKHHGAPRIQTSSNQIEIKKQLDKLLNQNIIRPSTAPYYSQVHLAEKAPKGSG